MVLSEKKVLEELSADGFSFCDLNEIRKQKKIDNRIAEIILKWLPSLFDEHVGSGIIAVQCLQLAEYSIQTDTLIQLFEKKDLSFSVKSVIGFVLINAKTGDISGWMRNQLLKNEPTLERSSLIDGIVKKGMFKKNEELLSFCKEIFDKYSAYDGLYKIFEKYGTKTEIEFMERREPYSEKKTQKMIRKSIETIKRKIEKKL